MRARELQIVTPEAVLLNLPTAALGSRILARGIDVAIQAAALLTLVTLVSLFSGFSLAAGGNGTAGTIAFVAFLLVATVIWLGYPIVFETLWRGRTPGKAALGLRVVTDAGAPIRFRHALVRGVLGLIDVWLFGAAIGVLTILFSRKEQRFGDMAAGTIVVRERSGARAPSATMFAPPYGCEEYVANLDVSGIDPAAYEAVRSFLLRAGAIAPAARADLAARLATPLLQQLHHHPPEWMGPDLWLACLAAAYQRRHGGPWQGDYGGYPPPGYPSAAQSYPPPGPPEYPPDRVPLPASGPPTGGFSPPD